MKKWICVLLSAVMLLSGTLASAAGLDFLTNKSLLNYSAVQELTMEMEIAPELLDALYYMVSETELEDVLDFSTLIKDLLSQNQTLKASVKISDDFKRVEMSMEAEVKQDIRVNTNFDVQWQGRSGMWLDMDLRDSANPKLVVITSTPTQPKYMVMDVFAILEQTAPEDKKLVSDLLALVYNPETMQKLMQRNLELVKKYATVQEAYRSCSIHFDSENFSRYISELICEVVDWFVPLDVITPAEADEIKIRILTTAPQISLLGTDGCSTYISFNGSKNVQKMIGKMDLEISLSEIMTLIDPEADISVLGGEGKIFGKIYEETKMTAWGDGVKVKYPTLTEENSVSVLEMIQASMQEEEDYDYSEEEIEYPWMYVYGATFAMPVIDGEYYVPLRATFQEAYDDEFEIAFSEDGTLEISSTWFDTIYTKIGATTATVNGKEIEVGEVILHAGTTTYVSRKFFEKIFGWQLVYLGYDLPWGEYYYEFITKTYDD